MLTIMEAEFGKMPIKSLESQKARGVFIDYQEEIAFDREREADNRLSVPSVVFVYAADKGRISPNPLEKFSLFTAPTVPKSFGQKPM